MSGFDNFTFFFAITKILWNNLSVKGNFHHSHLGFEPNERGSVKNIVNSGLCISLQTRACYGSNPVIGKIL